MDYAYHSAIKSQPLVESPRLARWESSLGVALTHDLAADPVLPAEFAKCDVFYAEPPFPAGWKVFHDRLNLEPAMAYRDFIRVCSELVAERGGVLIVSKQAEKFAAPPRYSSLITLHRDTWEALALWYGMVPTKTLPDVPSILRHLAQQFEVVGDFCSGYGYTGRIFVEQGKRFVLSDVDPHCTGYVSEHAEGWSGNGLP